MKTEIFVFGSNEQGIHGSGAAKYAREKYGAVLGVGIGPTGNSYALPTKKTPYQSLKYSEVIKHIEDFISYAKKHPELDFKVTRVGCGLAGFKDEMIAPIFINAPTNCVFDYKWTPWLVENKLRKFFVEGSSVTFFAMTEFNP